MLVLTRTLDFSPADRQTEKVVKATSQSGTQWEKRCGIPGSEEFSEIIGIIPVEISWCGS